MLHRIVEWDDVKQYDLSSLRVVVCTGAPLREEIRAKVRELFGNVVYDLYGSTEMGWVTIATPEDQLRKPGTVGRPVEGVRLRILDKDGNEMPPGEQGEVWASSALLMQGYLDDPELERERIRDGFVSVRDVGYLDDGYLHLVDRADDMIISGGVNVYPAEAEVALGSHPDVVESAVFGVPDPEWGQKIVAAVVARTPIDARELISFTKERADAPAVPKEIRFVDELPRNDVGKVDKKRLKEQW
jgi:acyl-CoA synthetase (AMP-forming)/AMP-acid ligase II